MNERREVVPVSLARMSFQQFQFGFKVFTSNLRPAGAIGPGRPLRFAAHRQPLCWNFMYHSRIVLSVDGSVRYMVRSLRCTVTIDSVLANSKTQNAFLFTVHAIFRHDYPLAVEPPSTPRPPVQKKNFERFSTH